MSALRLGYRLTCDNCGTQIDGDSEELDGHPRRHLLQHASDLRLLAGTLGWIVTGYRRVDGRWPQLDFADRTQRPRGGAAAIFDICPCCAPSWVPPFCETGMATAAHRTGARLVGPASDQDDVSALREEIKKLQAMVASFGTEASR